MSTLSPTERDALLEQFELLAEKAPFQFLTHRHIDLLTETESDAFPIISLYLDLGPQARQDRAWAIQFKNLSRVALSEIEDAQRARSVAAELERLEALLAHSVPELGRGLALFVAQPLALQVQIVLPVPLPNRLKVDRRPYLRPLFRVLDEHDRFLVAVIGNQRARLFVTQLGSALEVADLISDVPGRQSQGGWAQMRLQRRRDVRLQWHAGAVAHAVSLAMDYFDARWLLLSASTEVEVEFRKSLPASISQRLAGEFSIESVAPASQVVEATAPLRDEVEAREELAAVRQLHEVPDAGARALGLDEVLLRLAEGRVRKLLVLDDYRASGGVCPRCNVARAESGVACRFCGEPLQEVDDVVDMALEMAYRQSASLELVRSEPARSQLRELAPIVALLRF